MAENINITATIDGQDGEITLIESMKINQRIFGHHNFEIVIPARVFAQGSEIFDCIPDLIGKEMLTSWEVSHSGSGGGAFVNSFNGIITDVSVSGNDYKYMNVVLRGSSPTILLDGVLNTNTYADMTLKDLFNASMSSNLISAIPMSDNLSYTNKLPFVVQYNETDFDFMARMLQSHGEWFYYDGINVVMGLDTGTEVALSEKRCHSIDFSYNLTKPVANLKGRDLLAHEVLDITAESPSPSDSQTGLVSDESLNLYPAHSDNYMPYPTTADGEEGQPDKDYLQEKIDLLKLSRANEGFSVHGVTDEPQLRIGQVINIDHRACSGTYVITSLSHSSKGSDNYQNFFSARPVDAGVPSEVRTARPRLSDCTAIVIDNQDPEKMGRVKVQFDWGEAPSPWLRMVMPHTGSGRGFYFVPELNEEVMVGFEMGMGEHPYVVGSLYNGQNKFETHFDGDNKIKSIKTVSGNEIIFNDHGSLTIHNAKNSMVLNCAEDGSIDIKTEGDLNFEAEKNMSITVGEMFELTVGENVLIDATGAVDINSMDEVNVSSNKNLSIAGGMDTEITAGKNMSVEGSMDTSIKGLSTTLEGSASTDVKSSGITNVKGSLVKIN